MLSQVAAQQKATSSGTTSVRVDGREQQRQEIFAAHQHKKFGHLPTFSSLTFSDCPANLFGNNGTKYRATVEAGNFPRINDLSLEVQLAVATSPVTVEPMTNWFDRINVISNGNNEVLATYYPDPHAFQLLARTSKAQMPALSKNINLEGRDLGYLGATLPLPVGTHTFTLPLTGSFWAHLDVHYCEQKQDIIFELSPASSIVVAGSGTISVTSLRLICEGQKLTDKEQADYMKNQKAYLPVNTFLDPVLVQSTSKTLTAGAQNKLELSALDGKAAALIYRPSYWRVKLFEWLLAYAEHWR